MSRSVSPGSEGESDFKITLHVYDSTADWIGWLGHFQQKFELRDFSISSAGVEVLYDQAVASDAEVVS